MPHKYTIKELEDWSDYDMLLMVVQDRQDAITNKDTVLSQRLSKLFGKLNRQEELTK